MARTEFPRRTLVAVLLVGVGLQGCSGEEGPAEPTVTAAAQTPTAEPSPSPSTSASPTADGSQARVGSFEDDFSDPQSGWHELDEPNAGSASYTDGTYVVTDVEGESPLRLPAPLEIKPGNADVQMSVTVGEVPSEAGLAGVFCRQSADQEFAYSFAITEDRTWGMFRDGDGQVDVL